ncbi:hypothetical protein RND81_13G157100 [Saponaria officinalis]|uniref:DCD domain-containing protein n=1 Tax=Saponaria officinalis TaxID=3572 RepID=A0AAW1GY91_SAPOF
MRHKSLPKKRMVKEPNEANSAAPADVCTISQHVNSDVATTSVLAATINADMVKESDETNSAAPADVCTISQHVSSDVATTTVLASTVNADTGQGPKLEEKFAGYIFMCNAATKPDCFAYRVFGLPASRIDVVKKITPYAKLFLFDFDVRLLYGPYQADSIGMLSLEPYAFRGKFPAQVKFSLVGDCLPLPEAVFKDAIKENYLSKSKFKQDLSYEQAEKLISLFRPIPIRSPLQTSPAYHTAAHHESSMNAIVQSLHRSIPGYEPRPVLQHLIHHYVPENPLLPLHCTRNQTVLSRGVESAPDPYHTQMAYERYGSTRLHQAYHPDDPSFQRPDTHSGYGYIPQQGINPLVPFVPSANRHYGHNLHSGSNYPGTTHRAVVVPTEQPVHAYAGQLASTTSYYTQSDANRAVPYTPQPGSSEVGAINAYSYYDTTCSTELSHGHGYQPYSVSNQTQHVIETREVRSAYGNQEYPHSQVSVAEGSADPNIYEYQNQGYSGYYQASLVSSEQVTNTGQSQGFSALPQTAQSGSGVAAQTAYPHYNQGY